MLRCEGLDKAFAGVIALSDVSLHFPTKGLVAIVGPNGAGKTTLFNVLTGFLHPDRGRCFLGQREVSHLAPHRIAQLGVTRTFQDTRLAMRLSALENLLLAQPDQRGEHLLNALFRIGIRAGEAKNRETAMRVLQLTGLETKALHSAGELSYGEQKLLSLATCMVTGAQVLLLDEPFAGVHPAVVERLTELLRYVSSNGKLIVFIEHDMASVRRVAEDVIVMDHGTVIARGCPEEVLMRPEIMEAYIA
jgi:ABC-type branched-subunit amino acid transport system ATPase component